MSSRAAKVEERGDEEKAARPVLNKLHRHAHRPFLFDTLYPQGPEQ